MFLPFLFYGGSKYTAELDAIITRATLEGFTLPTTKQLDNCNTLIKSMKSSGVWSKQDRIYNFAYNNSPNLIKYSQEFDNAVWSKGNITVSADTVVAPDSTTTADKLVESAVNGVHVTQQTIPAIPLVNYTLSFYLQAAEKTSVVVNFSDGSNSMTRIFNLITGTVDNSTGTTITSAGGGWWKCVMTRTKGALGNAVTPQFHMSTTTAYMGDGVSGYYIWGVQVEYGSVATTYQKTPTTNLLNFSRIDWKNPSTSPLVSVSGTMNFNEAGWMGNAVDGYLDTGFIPSSHGINYTLNNAGRTAMMYALGSGTLIDGNTANNNTIFSTSTSAHRINATINLVGGNVNMGGAGMIGMHRDNSTTIRFIKRTVETTGRTQTADVLPSVSQLLLRNQAVYSSDTIASYLIGASMTLTEATAYRNDFNTYLISIGMTPNNTA